MLRVFPYFVCVVAVASAALGQQTANPYQEVVRYRFDQPRTAVLAIEAEIRTATPEKIRDIEENLLKALQSPEATTDAKAWICRQLRQVGSERSIDALVPLLGSKDLAPVARLALQSIPGPKVDQALRAAVSGLQGDQLAGVIQTIGVRGDRQAVALLVPLLASNKDLGVTDALLFALGHIGGAESLHVLQQSRVPTCLNRARCDAILLCAERMMAEGQTAAAAAAYHAIYTESNDVVIKTAALRGIVLCDKAKAGLVLLSALKSDHRRLRAAAAKFGCEWGDKDAMTPVLAALPSFPADTQVAILTMVHDKSALPAAFQATVSSDRNVCVAAFGAIGRLGDAAAVPLLLKAPLASHGVKGPNILAVQSLQELRGEGVVEAILAGAEQGGPTERMTAIGALRLRRERSAVPLLLKIVQEPESTQEPVASNTLLAIKDLADPRALPVLVELLVRQRSDLAQRDIQEAIVETCRHMDDKNAATAPVLAALPGASVPVRCALLGVLASVPGEKSLEALRAAVTDANADVRATAVSGLAAWPDAAAVNDLLTIAKNDKNAKHKILALRGVIRLAGPKGGLPAPQAVKLLAEAMSLADRVEEKKLALAALADTPHAIAIDLAAKCLSEPALEVEAATAVVKVAKSMRATNADAAAAAIQNVLDTCKQPAARQLAEGAMIVLGGMVNIAPQGTATSPDGLEKDGDANGDQAGIDGDPATYWDETDGQKLYRYVVTFKQPEKIVALSILGFAHHNFAPKDFEILCDGKVVKKVENAQYDDNFLLLRLDEITCTTVELKITGYYGQSPAIRELGIYRPKTNK